MLIGGDDISNDAITLGTCFSMFVDIRAQFFFSLIGRNLTAQSQGSHRGIGGGIQIPETLLPFPTPLPECPGELAPRLAAEDQIKSELPVDKQTIPDQSTGSFTLTID